MCSAWMTHAQSQASFTSWRWKKWRKTRRAILLFVLSTKTTKERFLLKRCQRNGNQKRIALPLLCRANYIREILNTLNILSGSFIIYSLKREISGLIFILLLVVYYSTKITLGVLLALLCKRPVSIASPQTSFGARLSRWTPKDVYGEATGFIRPAKFLILLKPEVTTTSS